jgi:hypothetical protein
MFINAAQINYEKDDSDTISQAVALSRVKEFLDYLKTGVIPQDYRFFRAVAILWNTLGEEEEAALSSALKSLELIKLDQSIPPEHRGYEEFYTLYWAATVFEESSTAPYNPYWLQAAQIARPTSPEERLVTQDILFNLVGQYRFEEDRKQAERLFEELKGSPDPEGTWLCLYMGHLRKENKYKEVVEVVTRYGSLRLAMSPLYDEEIHNTYQESARISDRVDVMLATYKDLISQLEPLKWSSPTKYHLANAYRRVSKSELEAKELLYQILDADGCFDPAVSHENEEVLSKSQMELSEIIYNQFLASSVLEEKRALLREMESLTNRRLAQANGVDSSYGTYSTSLARMYQKLGPIEQFYKILDAEFKECMDKLRDRDPDNDANTLRQLCKILSCVPGLEKDAVIALSASFYTIDPTLDNDEPSSGPGIFGSDTDSDAPDLWSDVDTNPTDMETSNIDAEIEEVGDEIEEINKETGEVDTEAIESDTDTIGSIVDGDGSAEFDDVECKGCEFNNWDDKTRSLFQCIVCTDCILCGICVKSLDESSRYCGTHHSHVEMGTKGWIGVKNGEIHIEHDEPVQCREWLTQLQEQGWPRAWEHVFLG